MTYQVHTIKNEEGINTCPLINIDHYMWSEKIKPKAFARMALLENYGLIISMTAIEENPLRRYTKKDSPVYRDSALEAFLNFAPGNIKTGYLNFEMNGNGAMLSQFGRSRNRENLLGLTPYTGICKAQIEEKSWNVMLKIPMELICDLYKREPLQKGDRFTCNFYKISEEPSIEHYASYAPIKSPVPNFHLPEYFGRAKIV